MRQESLDFALLLFYRYNYIYKEKYPIEASMQFHYERELIKEGNLHRKPGVAQGIPLREVVNIHTPLGVNFLIYAGIADALTDAHNNNILHGDVSVDDIFLTRTSVIINGFGLEREQTRAPEQYPLGP